MKLRNGQGFIPCLRNILRLLENASAQRDSRMYNLRICCSTHPSRMAGFGTSPRRAKVTTPQAIFENSSAQRDSKIYKSGMRGLRILRGLGVMRVMREQPVIKNSSAQQHSKMSRSELFVKNSSAQRDSKNSKSKMRVMGHMGLMMPMGWEKHPAQRHSKMSNLEIEADHIPAQQHSNISKSTKLSIVKQDLNFCHKTQDLPLLGVTMIKRLSAQRYSKNSNGRLSGILCWPHGQDINNSPAQRDSRMSRSELSVKSSSASKITKSGAGVMRRMRIMGIMERKTKIENSPAQRDSKNSKFKKNQTLHSLHELHGEEMYWGWLVIKISRFYWQLYGK